MAILDTIHLTGNERSAGGPIIQTRDVRVTFGTEEVLRGVDLEIMPGEFVSVVGKSGSGKSTLLYVLCRFLPAKGTIDAPRHFGIVFQSYTVYPFLTVAGNVDLALNALPEDERRRIVHEYLDLVELTAHSNKYPAQLSGGQNQRVALARALAARPAPLVLYCDEPFGSLDLFTRDKMQTLLMKLWEKQRTTILFVTHSIEEAIFLSDRVLVLNNGKIASAFLADIRRPREPSCKFSEEFVALKKRILESMESFSESRGLCE
jgi:NitT/TauT family transport system ATP-binding protein